MLDFVSTCALVYITEYITEYIDEYISRSVVILMKYFGEKSMLVKTFLYVE